MNTETETETETFFSDTLMSILSLLKTLPRGEREELLHHVKCSLADVNRMYGQVLFGQDLSRLSPRQSFLPLMG